MRYFLLFLFAFPVTSLAQPERVEPMNWWTGMKNPQVQLLVYGKDIAVTMPTLQYPGVRITRVSRATSSNYLFIDLHISPQAKPGKLPIRFVRQGKVWHTHLFSLLEREKGSSQRKGFSSADVVYLVTPDRFANGDPGNDEDTSMREKNWNRAHPYGRHGGDIRGMIRSLDYIRDMGFTALWPTPLLENDMPGSSYHGYAITDHYRVDPRFGTLADYRELALRCREKGIKLIFDGVVNHTGSYYWWMKDLPFTDWLNYPDSLRITNHRRTVNQDPYAAFADRELMVKGWFVEQMPDLNQENPFLANYLIQNTIWWVETLGLGGIRQDTYPYSPKKFLEQWTCRIMQEYPQFSIVGEEWSLNPLVAAYWQQGKANNSGYKGCLKSTMDFPLQGALVQALTEPETWDKGLVKLYEALANDFVYAQPNDLLVFGDNHDMDRLFTSLNQDTDLLQMALTYLLTIRGIPQLYYGTEVLLHNSGKPGDHGTIRADFPGGWPGDTVNAFTGKGLSDRQRETQQLLKKLLQWRKNKPVIHEGKTLHFGPKDGVYVYFRYNRNETVMVVLNKNEKESPLPLSRFTEITASRQQAMDILTGENFGLDKPIIIPARSARVYELK